MGYYHPVPKKGNQADLARQYGVAGVNHPRPGTTNRRGGFRSHNQVEAEISAAMANDYDTREFLKYNDEARKKMKNGIPSNRKQNTKLHEMMKQAHKDDGNGGKFSSAADYAGVAQNAFETYEDNERKRVDKLVAGLENKVMNREDETSPTEKSPNLSFEEYMQGTFGENADSMSSNTGQYTADKEAAVGDKAQEVAQATVNKIKKDKNLMARGKAKQGQYALTNLGSREFQSNQEGF